MSRFRVMTETTCGGSDCWQVDDKPQRFETEAEALAAIDEFFDDLACAGMADKYDRADYSIDEVDRVIVIYKNCDDFSGSGLLQHDLGELLTVSARERRAQISLEFWEAMAEVWRDQLDWDDDSDDDSRDDQLRDAITITGIITTDDPSISINLDYQP